MLVTFPNDSSPHLRHRRRCCHSGGPPRPQLKVLEIAGGGRGDRGGHDGNRLVPALVPPREVEEERHRQHEQDDAENDGAVRGAGLNETRQNNWLEC